MAVVKGRKTGIISSVKRFSGNPHDNKKLEESLAQSERVRKSVGGTRPKKRVQIDVFEEYNALLAGIGYNLKIRFNQIKQQILFWLEPVLRIF